MLWNLPKSYIDSFACVDYYIIKRKENTKLWSFSVSVTLVFRVCFCALRGQHQNGTLVFLKHSHSPEPCAVQSSSAGPGNRIYDAGVLGVH